MTHVEIPQEEAMLFLGILREYSLLNTRKCVHCQEYLGQYDIVLIRSDYATDALYHTFHYADQSLVASAYRSLQAEERQEAKEDRARIATSKLWAHAQTFDGANFHSALTDKVTITA